MTRDAVPWQHFLFRTALLTQAIQLLQAPQWAEFVLWLMIREENSTLPAPQFPLRLWVLTQFRRRAMCLTPYLMKNSHVHLLSSAVRKQKRSSLTNIRRLLLTTSSQQSKQVKLKLLILLLKLMFRAQLKQSDRVLKSLQTKKLPLRLFTAV